MAVVSYNQEEMEHIVAKYNIAHVKLGQAKKEMAEEVKKIKNSWSGTDALRAYEDLDAINNLMENVVSNVTTVFNTLQNVRTNFEEIKWTQN